MMLVKESGALMSPSKGVMEMYSRRQYKVSVPCRLPTVPYFKKTPSKTVPFYSAGRDAILL